MSAQAVRIMGILNITPNSFYDGGKYVDAEAAIDHAEKMIADGADIIDIGAESTGPGSSAISEDEELSRIMPVLTALRERRPRVTISIDTYRASTAREALDAGASMINDITGGIADESMFPLIAESGCDYVLMRTKDASPRTTIEQRQYDDVLQTIHEFFEERIEAALDRGIKQEQLILDPGLGHFVSSDPQYSWHILEHLEFLSDFGCRVLVSPSRKSFTAGSDNLPPAERLENTLKATQIAVEHGAAIVRTHDVAETLRVLE